MRQKKVNSVKEQASKDCLEILTKKGNLLPTKVLCNFRLKCFQFCGAHHNSEELTPGMDAYDSGNITCILTFLLLVLLTLIFPIFPTYLVAECCWICERG